MPAASAARTVTELLPTRSGITAVQAVLPAAIPAVPKLVVQETCVTPTLSLAVPAIVTEAAVVDMVPVEGDVMVNVGAVVSGLPLTDCRPMVVDFKMRVAPMDAVTVMVLVPSSSGTLTMLQADAGPAAVPEAPPLDDHVTVMTPFPPVADPDKLTLGAVVGETTVFTIKVRGSGGPVGAEDCGA